MDLLEEWRAGGVFLFLVLEGWEKLKVKTGAFVRESSAKELVLGLENSGELRLLLADAIFHYLDITAAPGEIKDAISCTLQIRFSGLRLSLSALRKQPVINWRDDA